MRDRWRYAFGRHPTACTCVDCVERRPRRLKRKPKGIPRGPAREPAGRGASPASRRPTKPISARPDPKIRERKDPVSHAPPSDASSEVPLGSQIKDAGISQPRGRPDKPGSPVHNVQSGPSNKKSSNAPDSPRNRFQGRPPVLGRSGTCLRVLASLGYGEDPGAFPVTAGADADLKVGGWFVA